MAEGVAAKQRHGRGGAAPVLVAFGLWAGAAQVADGVFELGAVTVVSAPVKTQAADEAVLGREEMARYNADTVVVAQFGALPAPERVRKVFAAGPPASVLVAVSTPKCNTTG